MAKKRTQEIEDGRQSRKEILRARRQAEQLRQVRIAVGIVVGLLLVVVIVGIVNEFFIVPNRPVAIVNDVDITLSEWQDRVQLERAQRIIFLENQYEAFEGNVGIIQQFAGQTILELQDADALAQGVLDVMVEEEIIRQQAEARGISVSETDIDDTIGELFLYFDGDSPTPFPTATSTVMPTPSLTPIPTPVITEVVPTEVPIPSPSSPQDDAPQPTPTPVSEEAFQEQFGELLDQFKDYGVAEEAYRETVRASLYREQLLEVVGDENEVATEAEQVSVFVLTLASEADANEAQALVKSEDFLTIWNQVRSTSVEAAEPVFPGATANEYLWRTEEILAGLVGDEAADAAFSLPVGIPSNVLVQQTGEEATFYHLIQVSGREVRDLPQSTVDGETAAVLQALLDSIQAEGVEITDAWRSRVPNRPLLDPKFLVQPTPAPTQPPLELPTPEPGS